MKLRYWWLRALMNHSLNLEAAYSMAAAQYGEAARAAMLEGRDSTPLLIAQQLYQSMRDAERGLQEEYLERMNSLRDRPRMLEQNIF
ncbi:MAG: hypothetical protein IPM06_17690 [Rhizobiales bacterium]|nr:hypothetical protein [Hyphomicrobiales bacterium]